MLFSEDVVISITYCYQLKWIDTKINHVNCHLAPLHISLSSNWGRLRSLINNDTAQLWCRNWHLLNHNYHCRSWPPYQPLTPACTAVVLAGMCDTFIDWDRENYDQNKNNMIRFRLWTKFCKYCDVIRMYSRNPNWRHAIIGSFNSLVSIGWFELI